jgi:hypothetical protein
VDAAEDFRAGQGLAVAVLRAHRHQRRHFALGDLQLTAAPVGQADVRDVRDLVQCHGAPVSSIFVTAGSAN